MDGSGGLSKLLRYRRLRCTTCAIPAPGLAVSAGVNVLALARMLGHKDPSVTLRVYADLFDSDLDAVADALDLKCAHSVPKPRPLGMAGA